jgi:hypothetical protein
MRYNHASDIRSAQASPAGWADPPTYPDDLLPELQSTLSALADLEVRYEIAQDSLEEWSGSDEDKQRLRAELAQVHRQAREPYLQHLALLQEQGTTGRSHH